MEKRDDELIAMVLGDAAPSPEMKRWLETKEGQRELAAYRKAVSTLSELYEHVHLAEPKPVVYYAALITPIGRLFAAATETGLVRLSFTQSESDFVSELQRQLKTKVVKSAEKLTRVADQLQDYLVGKRRAFDTPLDLRLTTPFQRRVLLAALKIPRGHTATYMDIARRIGQPRAARAVGQALGHNPIPIVIPCHRVLASDGSLGGYSGGRGIETKAHLLQLEGAQVG